MTISVDWGDTKVISVEKTDMTLVQSNPVPIYNLDLDWFRLTLLDLQDDVAGRPWQKTFIHETETTFGGLTYARKIQILDPYTVTFEDGQYAVNLVGANSNVADKTNVNQVSIRPQNSAGMTSSPDVEYASFGDVISYDETSPYSGTGKVKNGANVGSKRAPVNNAHDILLISSIWGFIDISVMGDITIPEYQIDTVTPYVADHLTFWGSGKDRSTFIIPEIADVSECRYLDATVTGFLDGDNTIQNCVVENLKYIKGYIESCVLSNVGELLLGGSEPANIMGCYSKKTATINMGGSGQALIVAAHEGYLKLTEKNGPEDVQIGLNSGTVILDLTTVINGTFDISGTGLLLDENGDDIHSGTYGDLVIVNDLNNPHAIAETVMDYDGT